MLERFIAWYAPYSCLGCRTEGVLLCDGCRAGLAPAVDRCYRCHKLTVHGRTCPSCRRVSAVARVRAATLYEGLGKELVGQLKFQGARQAAMVAARELVPHLPDVAGLWLVPVPTASGRIRERGYDQAALIAKALAQLTGNLAVPCLARHGQHRQVGASRQQRLSQLSGDFVVRYPQALAGADIVLIDDVLTTGASIEAAAAALKAAGARQVEALIFARA